MYFNGLPEMNVEHVTVENTYIYARTGARINESSDVVLRNVQIVPEQGPALMLNNVKNLRAEGFITPAGMERALVVTGSRNRGIAVSSAQITRENADLSKSAARYVVIK